MGKKGLFQVCLANQALFKEISAAGKRISSGGAMTEKGNRLVDTGRPKWSCTWVGLTQIWDVPLAGGLLL